MKKQMILKSILLLVLTTSILLGTLPLEGLSAVAAEAAAARSSAAKADFNWVLEEAQTLLNAKMEQSSGGWRYVVIDGTYAVITGHDDPTAQELSVPAVLSDADVVGLASDALAKHTSLMGLMLPGNVYAIAKDALPSGVTLRGYNASYTQTFASRNGFAFQRVAEFDFRANVVDYADIRPENFERISQYEVRMRELEAARLTVGRRFFLIDPANPYAISYYTVASISEPVEGFVNIQCNTPEVEAVLRSYSGENEPMVLDRSTLVLYDGAELSPESRGVEGNTSFTLNVSPKFKLSDTDSLTVSMKYTTKFHVTYEGNLFGKKDVEISQNNDVTFGVSLKSTHKLVDLNDDPAKNKNTKQLMELIKHSSSIAKSKFAKPIEYKPRFGKGYVFSYAGIVNGQVVLGMNLVFEGEAEITASISETIVYSFKDGKLDKSTTTHHKTVTGSASASLKFGVYAELNIYIFCIKIFKVDLFAGIKGEISYEYVFYEGWDAEEIPVNMIDCASIDISLLIEIGMALGAVDAGVSVQLKDSLETPLCTLHLHIFTSTFGIDPNNRGELITVDGKDRFHFKDECPYDVKTVRFALPFLSPEEQVYSTISNVAPGAEMECPEPPALTRYDRHFLAWHTSPACDEESRIENWPYIIEESVTLYAGTARYHNLEFIYTNGEAVADRERAYATQLITLPQSKDHREIVSWAIVDEEMNILDYLPENSPFFLMRDRDIRLCAICTNDVSVRFYTGQGAEFRQAFAARGNQLHDPGYTDLSKPRYQFAGWTDAEGKDVTFPIQLTKDTPNLLAFHAKWEYTGEMTSTELASVHIGEGFEESTRPDNTPHYAFKTTPSGDGVAITGLRTSWTYSDADNVNQTVTYTPDHLDIPSRICLNPYADAEDQVWEDVLAIDSSAFRDNQTLRIITLPSSITKIGTEAFRGCTALEMIDLSSTQVTVLPVGMAQDCTALRAVLMPDYQITEISSNCFLNCTSLTKANISCTLGDQAFRNCTGLTELNFGTRTKANKYTIGRYAFADCTGLDSVVVADCVQYLGNYVFSGCTNITSLTIDGGVAGITQESLTIGEGSKLNTLVFGDGVAHLDDDLLYNDGHYFPLLENLTLASSVNSMGERALQGTGVKKLELYSTNLELGNHLFANSPELEEVILHGGIIGNAAFVNCPKLKKLTIGGGVHSVGNSAFYNCTALEDVIIEDGVRIIGTSAFENCSSLTTLVFPDTVVQYGGRMIQGCTSLENLTVGGGCKILQVISDGVITGTDDAPFYIGPNAKLKHLVIRSGVEEIGKSVFANAGEKEFNTYTEEYFYFFPTLETVTLPDTLRVIGERAFWKAGMTKLTIPGSIRSIGTSAFSDCKNLTELHLAGNELTLNPDVFNGCIKLNTVYVAEGVKSIGNNAFKGCKQIETLIFPNSVTSYGNRMIEGCTGLKYLTIGGGCPVLEMTSDSYTSGRDSSPFYIGPDSQLERLEILSGVEEIGESVFANSGERSFNTYTEPYFHFFPNLKTIILPQTLKTVGERAFWNTGVTTLSIPEGTAHLGKYAFADSAYLTSLTLGGSALTIDEAVFRGASELKTLTVKDGVTQIGSYAFADCGKLTAINIPDSVTSIGNYAFWNCSTLNRLDFPNSITSYGNRMIQGCNGLETLIIGGGCRTLEMVTNSTISGNDVSPFYIGPEASLKHLELRHGVMEIGESLFANSEEKNYNTSTDDYFHFFPTLETVILPESVQVIGNRAFYKAGLTSLSIPDYVTSIGELAFADCIRLEELYVSGDGLALNSSVFSECRKLKTVYVKEGVTSIAPYAFYNCNQIEKLVFPNSVTSYGNRMIEGCTNLKELVVGGGCPVLEMTSNSNTTGNDVSPFYIGPDSRLERLEILSGVEEIGESVFANSEEKNYNTYTDEYFHFFPNLKTIILPQTLKTVGERAFWNTDVERLVIPSKTTHLGAYAFAGSDKLTYLIVDGTGLTMDDSVFADSTALTTAYIEHGVQQIGSHAFSGCKKLENLSIADSVLSVGNYAFSDCKELDTLSFPDSILNYGNRIIQGCIELDDLTIGGGCPVLEMTSNINTTGNDVSPFYIGPGATLRRLEIRQGVTEIGQSVFANAGEKTYASYNIEHFHTFPTLEVIILPSGLETIGEYAFYQSGVRQLYIPNSTASIGANAFRESTQLKSLYINGNQLAIGEYAFSDCTALETVTIEPGVKSIGSRAFCNCAKIKKLTFPSTITSYGNRMIEGCLGLEDLTIGGGCPVLEMGSDSYTSGSDSSPFYIGPDSQLKRLELLDGITTIGISALSNSGERSYSTYSAKYFYTFPHLTSVILPESLTSIENTNLSQWPNVTQLHLGSKITSITDELPVAHMTFYTDQPNETVSAFAQQKGAAHVVRSEGIYPTFYLKLISRIASAQSVLAVSDGTMTVTRGTEGEEVTLEEGYVVLDEQQLSYGDTISIAEAPYADGYVFGGWYLDAEFTMPWNGGRMPACALTLYARMLPVSPVLYAVSVEGAGEADERLSEGWLLYASEQVVEGGAVVPPAAAAVGRTFDAWYIDAACTTRWMPQFDQMPAETLILYGRFVDQHEAVFAVNLPAGTEYLNTILPDGFSLYHTATVTENEWFYGPEEPVVSGYVFSGWFEEPSFEHEWLGQSMPAGGVTLYGRMERLRAGGRFEPEGEAMHLISYALEQDESSELYLPAKVEGLPVTHITDYAFQQNQITRLHLPESLASYGDNAFSGMASLTAYVISGNNPYFTTQDGVLYSKDMTVLLRYPAGRLARSFTIPDGIENIAKNAFEGCVYLKEIIFPEGLKAIGDNAFSGCTGLLAAALPDSVHTLGAGAFDGCYAMTDFSAYGLESIGEQALPYSFSLYVRGPVAQGALRAYCLPVQDGAEQQLLQYNTRLISLYIDKTLFATATGEAGMPLMAELSYGQTDDGKWVTGWYTDSALTVPWNFATDLMPDSDISLYTTTKEMYSWENCTIEQTHASDDGTETVTSISGLKLTAYRGGSQELVIPTELNGTKVIALGEDFLAEVRQVIYSVAIGPDVIEIADTALDTPAAYPFDGLVLADAGSYAQSWAEEHGYLCEPICYQLSFSTGGAAIASREAARGALITLPTPIRTGASFLGWYLDAACTQAATMDENNFFVMPGADTVLYAAWDSEGEIHPFTWEENASGVSITGCGNDLTVLTIPDMVNGVAVTSIASGAFENHHKLEEINLPASMRTIGERAFAGSSLVRAYLGGTETIGQSAFENCKSLTTLDMPCAAAVEENAFNGCILLRSLSLPQTLAAIKPYAFGNLTAIKTISLPASLTQAAENAFANCVALTTVDVGLAQGISSQAFEGCTSLAAFMAGEGGGYQTIDGVLFSADGTQLIRYPRSKSDASYAIPEGVIVLAPSAFSGAANLAEITIPSSLEIMGEKAFYGCTKLTAFEVPADSGLAAIPVDAFSGCYALTYVDLGSSVIAIDAHAFLACPALKDVVIPESTISISESAFGSSATLRIIAKTGSTAHVYALEHALLFSDPDAVEVETLGLSADTTVLQRGERTQLTLSFTPAEAEESTVISWKTSDPAVVLVHDGLVRAIGGGTAYVTATAENGVTAQIEIEVQVAVQSIALNPLPLTARNDTVQASAVITPASATNQTLVWTSSDHSVFTTDENGLITAVGEGEATLTATAHNGIAAQIQVQVYNAVESIALSVPAEPLYAVDGLNTMQLAAEALPRDATDTMLIWESLSPEIATVNQSGLVTALKPGSAVITVQAVDAKAVSIQQEITVQARDLSALTLPEIFPVPYNTQAQFPVFTLEMDGRTLEKDVDYTFTMDEAIDAGEYPFTITGIGCYTGTLTGVFTIQQAQTQLNCFVPQTARYGVDEPVWTVTPSVPVTVVIERAEADGAFTVLDALPEDDGKYRLTLTVAETDNHTAAETVVSYSLIRNWINLSASHVTLHPQQTVRVQTTQLPADREATQLSYTSSSSAVTVTANGQITAISEGNATILIKAGQTVITAIEAEVTAAAGQMKLPAQLTAVSDEAFLGNASIVSVVAGEGLQSIGSRAFADMAALKQIHLPAGTVQIAADAFEDSSPVLFVAEGSEAEACAIRLQLPYVLE